MSKRKIKTKASPNVQKRKAKRSLKSSTKASVKKRPVDVKPSYETLWQAPARSLEEQERLTQEKRAKQKKEDFEMISKAINGNQTAFKDLMTRYRGQIFSLMFRMVHSQEEAEDLVQEAFMKAFMSLKNFNYEYAFSTWLYKIATNNCIDHLRKKKLQTFSIDAPIAYKDSEYQIEIPDLTYHPEKEMMKNERAGIIKTAIDELPEKYKRVIFLRHSEELSYEEISEMLKIPIGTVKARIFRAREMLNKFLKGKIDKVL